MSTDQDAERELAEGGWGWSAHRDPHAPSIQWAVAHRFLDASEPFFPSVIGVHTVNLFSNARMLVVEAVATSEGSAIVELAARCRDRGAQS